MTSGSPLARRLALWIPVLGFLLLATALVALATGAARLDLGSLFGAARDASARAILFDLRLPRVLAAAALGGLLSVAGVGFQAILRNPLADPYVLGVAGGASLGGVAALVAGAPAALVPLAAFAGALAALAAIERLAAAGGRLSIYSLLLTGAIFNAFSGALIYFLQSVASREQLQSIVFYLMGRVPAARGTTLALLGGSGLVVTLAYFASGRAFNALSLGEEGAAQLGVDVERLKRRTFLLGSLATALAVSAAGMIGFVGLVVPHLLRLALGPDHRLLVPTAFLGGAAFLVAADLGARTLVAPGELPVGVVTAILGGPFFLLLLRRKRGAEHDR